MEQVRHGSATTTHAVRAAIQRSQASLATLSRDCIYTDHGPACTNRARPDLDQTLAAVREEDRLVVPTLDRLARSVPDARDIADQL